jgi:hypothetical protein
MSYKFYKRRAAEKAPLEVELDRKLDDPRIKRVRDLSEGGSGIV